MSSRGFTDPNQRLAPYVDPHVHPVGVHDHPGIASATNLLWDDLRCSLISGIVGANTPALTAFRSTVQAYAFSASQVNEVFFDVQLPHGWSKGSVLHPHVHWSPGNSTATTVVRWELEYTWANIGAAFGTSTVLTVDAAAGGVAYGHQLTAFGTIDGTGKTDSSVLMCRIARLGNHANDTYPNTAFGLSVDFHIQYDSMGDPTLP